MSVRAKTQHGGHILVPNHDVANHHPLVDGYQDGQRARGPDHSQYFAQDSYKDALLKQVGVVPSYTVGFHL